MALIRRLTAAVGRRRLAMAAALVLWVTVIVLSSGPEPGPGAWLGFGRLPEFLWLTYTVLCLVFLIVILLSDGGGGPVQELPPRRGRFWSFVLIAVLLVLFTFAPRSLEREEVEAAPTVTSEEETPSVPAEPFTGPGWGQGLALTGVAAAAAAALMWSSLRAGRPASGRSGGGEAATLPGAAIEARRRLLDTTDPRMGVLAAYAHLEDALAAQGRGRTSTETPTEHMRRVTDTIALRGQALGRLALLYEHARFSGNEITEADRRAAEADLARLITDLEAVADTRPTGSAPSAGTSGPAERSGTVGRG